MQLQSRFYRLVCSSIDVPECRSYHEYCDWKVRHHLQMIRNAAMASVNHHPPRMKVVAMVAVARDVFHVVVRSSARKIGCNEIYLANVLSRMVAAMAR